MSISERLIELRKFFRPNSASAFAKELKIGQTTYSNYENGTHKVPLFLIEKLITVYNINANWLIIGKGEMFIAPQENEKSLLSRLKDEGVEPDSDGILRKKN